jgi:radical SAM superfamily enzyme YgiQ (UPF0313 family)
VNRRAILNFNGQSKILLLLMPFWTPLIPPMGLACLKAFLQQHGFEVKTMDLNVEGSFRQFYDDYFAVLEEDIPSDKQGNFDNIGIDVLQNHMTAHFSRFLAGRGAAVTDDSAYFSLINDIVAKNFFVEVDLQRIRRMDEIIAGFFRFLDGYLAEVLEEENPGVLGVSMYKGTFAPSLFAFKRTRETFPHIGTVMGGGIFSDQLAVGSPNFKLFLESTPYIDKIIVGEGELMFLKLLRGELPEGQRVFTLRDLGGEMLDLAAAPLPDFSDFQIIHYPQMAAYTSRSCPFQCGFCAETVNWGRFRKKQAPKVAEELRKLHRTYGSQLYLMSDSLLNPIVTPLAEELCESDVALYWDGYLRADAHVCDPDNAFLWRRGGFYRARLGIESGSPRILELMDKRITPEQIRSVLANLALAGIKTSTYWVIGYPGESEEDFQHTLDLIEEMKDDIYEAECNPFRFYLTGQVQSEQWVQNTKSRLLYPEHAGELLIMQTWVMEEGGVPRQEIYSRLNRFVQHCKRLGVPNPYSWPDIHKADQRWQELHSSAVPPLVKFRDADTYIDECKRVEKRVAVRQLPQEEGDFVF